MSTRVAPGCAPEVSECEEQKAVRSAQGQGDVEGAGRQNCELAEGVEAWWQEVRQRRQREARWNDCAAQGRRSQRRQGCCEEALRRRSPPAYATSSPRWSSAAG